MKYRSLSDLARCIALNAHRVPRDVDLVVGVPRSGLIAANLLALQLHMPLADIDGFLGGRTLSLGRRMSGGRAEGGGFTPRHALIVDDSISTGAANKILRDRLEAQPPPCKVTTAAVYYQPDTRHLVDLAFEEVAGARMFQWNMMHHYMLPQACLDIDGVLCHDPDPAANDDGPLYAEFLGAARSLWLPRAKVGWLVTSRLERYRSATEAWLKAHGVEYGELFMLDLPSQAERVRLRAHGSFKAAVYSSTPSSLFIESEDEQAREIAALSGKPVLCVGTHVMHYPTPEQQVVAKLKRAPRTLSRRVRLKLFRSLRGALRLPSYS